MNVLRIEKAQAILELAIFGAILLMLLGVLLNYGLRNSLQQRATLSAFRGALKESARIVNGQQVGQGSYSLIEDKHIPNLDNPFALGAVMPFTGSSNVIRDSQLHKTPDTIDELPRLAIDIKDIKGGKCPGSYFSAAGSDPPCYYLLANFRDILISDLPVKYYCDPDDWVVDPATGMYYCTDEWRVTGLDKYQVIFGDSGAFPACTQIGYDFYFNPICVGDAVVRTVDPCMGEIFGYDTCKRQCRMMENTAAGIAFCKTVCADAGRQHCDEICDLDISPTASYCSNLDSIFNFAKNGPKQMGVQPDYAQRTTVNNTLLKTEGAGGVHTTDSINWSTTTDRTIASVNLTTGAVQQLPVTTNVGENVTCQDGNCP